MGDPALRKVERFTYKEYQNWPEDEHWELIDGEAFAMAPPRVDHQRVVRELALQAGLWFRGKGCELLWAPVGVLLPQGDEADDEVDTILEPDLLVVCDSTKVKEKIVRGAPDWVVEVLSPSTGMRDLTEKRRLYEKHGVREYWVVNPVTLDVTLYRRTDDGFPRPEGANLKDAVPVAIFPGLVVSVVFDPPHSNAL